MSGSSTGWLSIGAAMLAFALVLLVRGTTARGGGGRRTVPARRLHRRRHRGLARGADRHHGVRRLVERRLTTGRTVAIWDAVFDAVEDRWIVGFGFQSVGDIPRRRRVQHVDRRRPQHVRGDVAVARSDRPDPAARRRHVQRRSGVVAGPRRSELGDGVVGSRLDLRAGGERHREHAQLPLDLLGAAGVARVRRDPTTRSRWRTPPVASRARIRCSTRATRTSSVPETFDETDVAQVHYCPTSHELRPRHRSRHHVHGRRGAPATAGSRSSDSATAAGDPVGGAAARRRRAARRRGRRAPRPAGAGPAGPRVQAARRRPDADHARAARRTRRSADGRGCCGRVVGTVTEREGGPPDRGRGRPTRPTGARSSASCSSRPSSSPG